MSLTVYIVSAVSVFFFSGLLAMAGLGAAFIFVPLFYYLGVPIAEAVPTALLLNVVSRAKPRTKALSRAASAGAGAAVGVVAGFLGGLLGVGGGNFIVPVLNGLGIDAKVAAGTTAMVVVFASLSGFLGHVSLGGLSPLFLGLMALMSALGSIAGSHLMKSKITSAQLKKIIGGLLWLIAAKMIFDLVK